MSLAELQAELAVVKPKAAAAQARFDAGEHTALVKNQIALYGGRVQDLERAIEVKRRGLPTPRTIIDFFKYGRTFRRR